MADKRRFRMFLQCFFLLSIASPFCNSFPVCPLRAHTSRGDQSDTHHVWTTAWPLEEERGTLGETTDVRGDADRQVGGKGVCNVPSEVDGYPIDGFLIGETSKVDDYPIGETTGIKERERRQIEEKKTTISAGEGVLRSYKSLPPDIQDTIVELDIINTPEVQEIRSQGILPDGNRLGRTKRAAGGSSILKWPNKRVPYTYHVAVSQKVRAVIREAMDEWELYTCIKFEEAGSENNVLYFIGHSGCYSSIGMRGGFQRLSVGIESYCHTKAVMLHELGHAIGFWHEQTRPDRDDYIKVVTANIIPGFEDQFVKYSRKKVDSLGVPYDYNSIMHYSDIAFSRNRYEPTIVPLLPNVRSVGQASSLSPYDILQANRLYNCSYINKTISPPTGPNQNNSFLIRNNKISMCLGIAQTRDPKDFKHSHNALYSVTLLPCDPLSPTQRWIWSNNNTLQHLVTFLSLATYNITDAKWLVLRTYKEHDEEQRWVCNGHYLEQMAMECNRIIVFPAGNNKARIEKDFGGPSSLQDAIGRRSSLDRVSAELESILDEVENRRVRSRRFDAEGQQASAGSSYVVTYGDCNEVGGVDAEWSITGYVGEEAVSDGGSICSPANTQSHKLRTCYTFDMEPLSDISHLKKEWGNCSHPGYYVNGFYHTYNIHRGNFNYSGIISGIRCCVGDYVSTPRLDGPATESGGENCHMMPWWEYTDYIVHEGWFTCPPGMLLKAMKLAKPYRRSSYHIITLVECCRPKLAPKEYMSCYTTNTTSIAGDTWAHTCHLDGFQVAGLFRKHCDEYGLYCEEEITCCMLG